MKLKTYGLTGQALDWAVALAIGATEKIMPSGRTWLKLPNDSYYVSNRGSYNFKPSTNWAQCGPLIAEHSIMLAQSGDKWYAFSKDNEFNPYRGSHYIDCLFNDADGWGETPLIAACHAIVASCIGEDIDIPDELCSPLDDLIRS
ncbi:phage protein NinX family protein [Xenorhabdus bovienii]|uniref:phage protein NinX family protein n=1 Tax=Xenorhabdus bovienii TaxID=40576 RepID=UPI000170A067|nr:phage protein NinX family protein [Xenorhabdus bovienii]CDG88099.1 conserved hypothetical protein [Xenorhabdus bovienii str. feltiae France]CDG91603.1 conserved hypothetical protein [Xenorhabdus bovienii str. feltiae Florida]